MSWLDGTESLRHKYDPLPEDAPRHRKKARTRRVRSDHRHEYEDVCIDAHAAVYRHGERRRVYYTGTRCRVCGKLADVRMGASLYEPPEGMALYEVDGLLALLDMKVLPDSARVGGDGE